MPYMTSKQMDEFAEHAQELVKKILDWVDRKFIVVYRSDDLRTVMPDVPIM